MDATRTGLELSSAGVLLSALSVCHRTVCAQKPTPVELDERGVGGFGLGRVAPLNAMPSLAAGRAFGSLRPGPTSTVRRTQAGTASSRATGDDRGRMAAPAGDDTKGACNPWERTWHPRGTESGFDGAAADESASSMSDGWLV